MFTIFLSSVHGNIPNILMKATFVSELVNVTIAFAFIFNFLLTLYKIQTILDHGYIHSHFTSFPSNHASASHSSRTQLSVPTVSTVVIFCGR